MNRKAVLVLTTLLALALIYWRPAFLERLDLLGYDFRLRLSEEPPRFPDLMLVEIDSNSITPQHPWPYRPKIYTEFLRRVEPDRPAAVVLDINLEAAPQISEPEYRELLADLTRYRNLIFSLPIGRDGAIQKLRPDLEKTGNVFGVAGIYLDPDSRVRRCPLAYRKVPCIPLVAAGAYLGYLKRARPVFRKDGRFDWFVPETHSYASEKFSTLVPLDLLDDEFRWRGLSVPKVSEEADMLIAYGKKIRQEKIPFWKILDGRLPRGFFKNKVLVIYLSSDISDAYLTPLARSFELSEKMPGGEILGQAINTILTRSYIRRGSVGIENLASVFLAVLFLGLLLRFGIFKGAYFFLLLALYLAVTTWVFRGQRTWIGWAAPLCSSLIIYSGALLVESRRFLAAFGTLLPKKFADTLESGKLQMEIGGREVEGTAMFVDMVGYTSVTEKSSLKETFALLQHFHKTVEEGVKPFGGVVCDWQGDGVLIFFSSDPSTPTPVRKAEESAVRSALGMKKRFESGARKIGVGIATGQVLWGLVGTASKIQPSAIGDPVNLASRLQAVGKESGFGIAADEKTYRAASQAFLWEELGAKTLKGKEGPVLVFSPKEARS